MNQRFIIGIIILLIALGVFLPSLKKAYIRTAIEKANYCDIDSDCIDAGGKCPFGCYIYVNKNEVDEISRLIDAFESNCIYDCILCYTATCEKNKCKEVCR